MTNKKSYTHLRESFIEFSQKDRSRAVMTLRVINTKGRTTRIKVELYLWQFEEMAKNMRQMLIYNRDKVQEELIQFQNAAK